jgi:hypothetical protein
VEGSAFRRSVRMIPKLDSVLKKWLSARSALQESPKTSPKHYENDVFGLRTGGTREREGVFQHAVDFSRL